MVIAKFGEKNPREHFNPTYCYVIAKILSDAYGSKSAYVVFDKRGIGETLDSSFLQEVIQGDIRHVPVYDFRIQIS